MALPHQFPTLVEGLRLFLLLALDSPRQLHPHLKS